MKKLKTMCLFVMLIFMNKTFSQETKFELTLNGYEPKVVQIDGLNKEDIYKLTKKWIVKTYKNPKEVLTADIENENVKINGFSTNIVKWSSGNGWDLNYTLDIEFKDNKYRLSISADIDGNQIEYTTFFKNDGTKRNGYKGGPESIDLFINNLVEDLNKYIKNKGDDNKW